ncbi:hypothetical protein [Paenibacillus riograndensis]|uniref:Uncharacterized protein n=2 Tax=Paenibacillus riograndensis TaxID=483937 RepID=A0A132U506_9BACL|nr:hypothetical protein [Paenibacillus riograndensis]KWX78674.1 hypothetical protein AMQ84_08770 [Paenibacillus riograndensis]CQR58449.1 hypothetical protein PRIO_6098 [Paenibacillus riograndensis SBR5]
MSRNINKDKHQNEQVEADMVQVIPNQTLKTMVGLEEEKQKQVLIYLGPNLPGGQLLQSTVFRSGIPSYLQPLLAEKPDVSELIVPIAEITAVQDRIVQTGTAEYVVYQRLLGKGI